MLQVGRVGVLEVGHEAARAGVQRVDHELAVGRTGDLHPAVGVVGAGRGDPPGALADLPRLGEEVERPARLQRGVALGSRGEQLAPPGAETAVQLLQERERVGAQDLGARPLVEAFGGERGRHGRSASKVVS